VLVPDLLGYGSSDKPDSAEEYKGKQMASDIVELLDYENISKSMELGMTGDHIFSRDWRTIIRPFYSYSFLGVGYMPLGIVFDLKLANAELKREVGYDTFGFWEFFHPADAPSVLKEQVGSSHPCMVIEPLADRYSLSLSTACSTLQILRCGSSIWDKLMP